MTEHAALQELAAFAARNHIQGRSFKRNSILDPFARMLEGLEKWPKLEDRSYLRAMLKDDIGAHIERASPHGIRAERRQAIYEYVDRFFERLLAQEHHDTAQHLLERARLLKGAYLIFFREALPPRQRQATDEGDDTSLDDVNIDAGVTVPVSK